MSSQYGRLTAETFVALLPSIGGMFRTVGFHTTDLGAILRRDTDQPVTADLDAGLRDGTILVTTPHRVESFLANRESSSSLLPADWVNKVGQRGARKGKRLNSWTLTDAIVRDVRGDKAERLSTITALNS